MTVTRRETNSPKNSDKNFQERVFLLVFLIDTSEILSAVGVLCFVSKTLSKKIYFMWKTLFMNSICSRIMLCCETCGNLFQTQRFLNNHFRTKHQQNIIKTAIFLQCGECAAQFTKSCNLIRHLRNQHESSNVHRFYFCPLCFAKEKTHNDHELAEHGLAEENLPRKGNGDPDQVEATTVAVNNRFKTHCLKLPKDELSIDPFNYLVSQQQSIIDFIDDELQKVPNLKRGFTIAVDLVNSLNNDKVTAFFNSFLARIANITNEKYLDHVDQLMSKLNVFASSGSGWVIECLQSVELKNATCQTLSGSS